jgi:DNA-directed RNA polymerase subunit H (RpoH/RPB5)
MAPHGFHKRRRRERVVDHMLSITEKVLRSFQVVKEMLLDRGHDIRLLQALTDSDLEALMDNPKQTFTIEVEEGVLSLVYYIPRFRIGEFKQRMFEKVRSADIVPDPQYTIFVFTEDINSQGRTNVQSAFPNNQIFHLDELTINVTKNQLVPRHVAIRDAKEIEAILAAYNVSNAREMPAISRNDPQARYLDLKPGQLVRIERASRTACSYDYYRSCTA